MKVYLAVAEGSDDEPLVVPMELLDANSISGGPLTSSQKKRKKRNANVEPHVCRQQSDNASQGAQDVEGDSSCKSVQSINA